MDTLNYYVLDVFSSQRYKGNPLSVVLCDSELPTGIYYDIAREFGYSETSFVYYSTVDKAFKVRSFTPGNFEVSGAGHNLLGAVCLALLKEWDIFREQQGKQFVIMKDQKIPLVTSIEGGLPFAAMKQQPAVIIKEVPIELIAAAVGMEPEALSLNGWQAAVVKTEVAHLMVPVKNSDYLDQAVPNKMLLKQISEAYGFEGFYLFTTALEKGDYIAQTRFFNPGIGIDEDAATGTAAGPLAGYLRQLNFIREDEHYLVLQGLHLNQPSTIRVKATADGVWVSGSSIVVMEGKLYL